jgi:hypothetical protein
MKRWLKRLDNPTNLETILWASGAALLGSLIGFGIGRAAKNRPIWQWWTVEDRDGYVPHIQDPSGQQFVLSPEFTEFGAQNAAMNAIAERGGRPVEGRPIQGG